MNSSDVKKWYYILPVVSIGAFFVVWVKLAILILPINSTITIKTEAIAIIINLLCNFLIIVFLQSIT